MKKSILLIIISSFCLAFTSDLQKIKVQEGDFNIEFYVSLKKKKFEDNKMYYWYKSGAVHKSISNAAGTLLQGQYLKYYRSNQLAEKGVFNLGLKTGVWMSWHENGNLKLKETWKDGYKNGEFITYNSSGDIIHKSAFKNDLKTGLWIDYKTKDSIIYKKGEVFIKKKKKNLFKKLFKNKHKNNES